MLPALTALLPFASKILDKVVPDPEAKAKAQAELAQLQQSGELAKMANETELFKAEQQALTDRILPGLPRYSQCLLAKESLS